MLSWPERQPLVEASPRDAGQPPALAAHLILPEVTGVALLLHTLLQGLPSAIPAGLEICWPHSCRASWQRLGEVSHTSVNK